MLAYCSFTRWTPGGSENGPMKYGLSILLLCSLPGCFLGIESLGFPEFWHGARYPYHVVLDRTGLFGKLFLPLKLWKWPENKVF